VGGRVSENSREIFLKMARESEGSRAIIFIDEVDSVCGNSVLKVTDSSGE
jgi:ATP-dependent 26S proteasome regulatory subunit